MNKKYIIILSSIIALFVIAIILMMIWIQNFKVTGSEDSIKVVSSVIVFWGGLITSIITAFGIILKYSIDEKNNKLAIQAERRLELEAEKNNNLKADAENRLKLEAGIKAITLLSQAENASVCENQRSAVLHMLSSLGMLELALSLMQQMLNKEQLNPLTTVQIIERGLKSDNEYIVLLSSGLFKSFSKSLLTDTGGVEVPESITLTWPVHLPFYARNALKSGLMEIILARPFNKWKKGQLNSLFLTLSRIWFNETEKLIKFPAGIFLLEIIKLKGKNYTVFTDAGPFNFGSIFDDLSKIDKHECSVEDNSYIKRFAEWCDEAKAGSEKTV